MKKALCLLAALLLAFCLCACSGQETAAPEPVKYYEQSRYILHPTGDVNVSQNSYDENWNLLRTETLLNGNFASAVDYIYSEDMSWVTMEYSSAVYESHSTKVKRSFDSAGRVIKNESYEDGELGSTTEIFYDGQGREIKTVTSYPEGSVFTVERSFDKAGNLLCYSVDTGYYRTRQEYSYDSEGRLIREDYYRNDVLENFTDYSYQDNVRHGSVCDAQGTLQAKLMEVLDEAGNVLESERSLPDGTVQSYICYVYAASDSSISGKLPEQ